MLIACLIPAASAVEPAPYASDYFSSCNVTISVTSSNTLRIRAVASATNVMCKLGVSEIKIQKKGLIFWSDEITQTGTTSNGYLKTNTSSYDSTLTTPALTSGE